MKRTNEATVSHPAPDFGAEVGAKMRAERLGYADSAMLAAPDDDLFTKPSFPQQPLFLYRPAAGDEIPALRKRKKARKHRQARSS